MTLNLYIRHVRPFFSPAAFFADAVFQSLPSLHFTISKSAASVSQSLRNLPSRPTGEPSPELQKILPAFSNPRLLLTRLARI